MPSSRRKFVLRQTVPVDVGCSCRRPKLPSFLYSPPKSVLPKSPSPFPPSITASLSETTGTTATTAVNSSSSPSCKGYFASSPSPPSYWPETTAKGRKTSVAEGSTAMVKDSSDPYVDFRNSMLQMIVEMEIFAWDDLRDLLHRFLDLNAPRHHHLILRAFVELWNDIFSIAWPPVPAPAPASAYATA